MTPPFVTRYLIALNQHKLIGFATFFLITGISGIVAIQPTPAPIYRAEGRLIYTTPVKVFSQTGIQISEQGKQRATPETLLADNVVKEVAAGMQVSSKDIVKNTQVKLPKSEGPQFISVIYTDKNKEISATIVAMLMEKMVEQSRFINTAQLRRIIETIEKRLPQAEQELREAEQKLEQYDRLQGPALFAAQDGTLVGGITGSQQQQRNLEIQLEGVEAQYSSLIERLGLTPDQAYTSSALSADPIIASLRAQILDTETQMELLKGQLRPQHPTMIELRKQQQTYETLLQARAAEVLGGNGFTSPLPSQIRQDSTLDPARQALANQLVALQTQREALQRQLAATQRTEQELRQQYQQLPNKQLERGRLAQQVTFKQEFYNRLQAALADTKIAEAETESSLAIAGIAEPKAIMTQTASNPIVTLAIGGVIGIVVGAGVILLLSTLDNTLYTPEDVKPILRDNGVPLLGDLPTIGLKSYRGEVAIITRPEALELEFYERFRTNLRLREEPAVKVVLVTSTAANEGKTIVAYNLAIASAQAGMRTLLVEGDLRSHSVAQSQDVIHLMDAPLEPLRFYGSKSECIHLAQDFENLSILPSLGPLRKAAGILESSEMKHLLEDARGRFDFVVVDSPSLSRCNDALLLQPFTDGIVLVTRPGYTQGSILSQVIEELDENEVLLGAVINDIKQLQPPVPVDSGRGYSAVDTPVDQTPAKNHKVTSGVGSRE
ncbi:GumC family protein [Moorena bouillonii]|uniref:Lipopolysaccharide biosynthesis n=1 Tax=Moorena bouillonii PNG TaxID=568701 RepID=A0A1U7N3R8_9CYAN|nr:tyrosine-protein kinase domain-containing protein [Moorena bouillonii]OLT60593.1 lipopolysaccharide biosynthesis [Moorena bouillonii PNG]